MQIDNQELHDYYAALADEELLALDPAELTEQARRYYDSEIEKRKLTAGEQALPATGQDDEIEFEANEEEPDWLPKAACVVAYSLEPGSSAVSEAETAQSALLSAGIPCHILTKPVDPDDPETQDEMCVMVPGPRNLEATSVLERDIYNVQEEALWKSHFAALTDEEMRTLSFEVICAGIEDRLARLKRAYTEEMSRRRLSS